MNDTNEANKLYARESALADDVKRRASDPTLGPPCLLARTTVLRTYPTTAQRYFACLPLTLLGAEIEGGGGVVVAGSSAFFALNLGSSIPPAGSQFLATFVGNRWVFRFDA